MILKLQKEHKELIWGTEDWVISAHENGVSKVVGGEYDGLGLDELYASHRELFNNVLPSKFPLLVKIIDAKDDLSVQVHPNDVYAGANEGSLGKTECWYILDCKEDSDIIVGQTTDSREELQEAIDGDYLLHRLDLKPVKKGDFFYIPAGTVHAIRSNTKILEVQQSSDITYRLYDYKRVQADGSLREIHVDKALDVIDYKNTSSDVEAYVVESESATSTCLIKSDFFDVYKFDVKAATKYDNTFDYMLGVSLSDNMVINGEIFNMYESFVIPHGHSLEVQTAGSVVISTVVTNR